MESCPTSKIKELLKIGISVPNNPDSILKNIVKELKLVPGPNSMLRTFAEKHYLKYHAIFDNIYISIYRDYSELKCSIVIFETKTPKKSMRQFFIENEEINYNQLRAMSEFIEENS